MYQEITKFLQQNYKETDRIATMRLKGGVCKNRCCLRDDLERNEKTPDAKRDIYMTLNTVQYKDGSIKRDQDHIRRLKFLYADLDTYHTEFSNEQILMNLEENYFNREIPVPSYVISSGRGMYLLWSIDEHVYALPRWKRVQRFLYSKLKEFGADNCVTEDHSRLFRTIGSINSKSGKTVCVLRNYNRKYSLYEIMEEFMQETEKEQERQKRANRRYIPLDQANKLYAGRIRDLRNLLINFRDKEDCGRENILFLYRYYQLCLQRDEEYALKSTLKLNAQLAHPLSEKEVIRATASAETYFHRGESFSITCSGMTDFLSLSSEEIAAMPCILTKERLKERRRRTNRSNYINRLKSQGRALKSKAIFERRKKIYHLLQKGLKNDEIIRILDIGRSTYWSDRKIVDKVAAAMKGCGEVNVWAEPYRDMIQETEAGAKNSPGEVIRFGRDNQSNMRNGPNFALQI